MVRITGQRRPDRGTIGRSSANRDYRMSTYDGLAHGAVDAFVLDDLNVAAFAGLFEAEEHGALAIEPRNLIYLQLLSL